MRPRAYLEVGLQGLPGGTSNFPAQLPHEAAPSSVGGVFPMFSPTECCANTWKSLTTNGSDSGRNGFPLASVLVPRGSTPSFRAPSALSERCSWYKMYVKGAHIKVILWLWLGFGS